MPISEEILEQLRGFVATQVAGGFSPRSEIIDAAVDFLSDEVPGEELRATATWEVDAAIRRRKEDESHWPEVTDCDRLDRAFDTLEAHGIVCRHNFTCCGTCGAAEIWDEMDARAKDGHVVRGYAFYHSQDTDSAAEGYGLCLNYGSIEEGEAPALAVAQEVVKCLREQGLKVEWNGAWNRRIEVPLDWKRRFPDAAA